MVLVSAPWIKVGKVKYRPEIDGLRAVAVAPVILFHAGIPGWEGGYVGVDIFFVISGYLITSIIISEISRNAFSIVGFYDRRIRRIIPALAFVCLASIPAAYFYLTPSDLKGFGQSLVAITLFSSNFLFWLESGYFDNAADFKPLLHTWSLAVEEQFYIFFPILIIIFFRFGRSALIIITVLLSVLSIALAEWMAGYDSSANFFLLPTRAWELGIGAVTALSLASNSQTLSGRPNNVLSVLGLSMVAGSILFFDSSTRVPGLYGLLPTIGTAFIILGASAGSIVGKLLSWGPFVRLGLISYSAYLWHQPIFAFARHSSGDSHFSILEAVILIFGVVILSFLTWRFIEIPFRNRDRVLRVRLFLCLGVATGIIALAGLYAHIVDGRVPGTERRNLMSELDTRLDFNFGLSKKCDGGVAVTPDCRSSANPNVLIWGDSVAMHLAQAVLADPDVSGLIQITASQCPPILGFSGSYVAVGPRQSFRCVESNARLVPTLEAYPSIRTVIVSSTFSSIAWNDDVERVDESGALVRPDQSGFELFLASLERIRGLGIEVVLVSPLPSDGNDKSNCIFKALLEGTSLGGCDNKAAHVNDGLQVIEQFFERLPNWVRIVRLRDALCNQEICRVSDGNTIIYRDAIHLSREGSAYIGKRLDFVFIERDESIEVNVPSRSL
jgi:peptidoglycan/LPS O-acetylase OafA/YrhL